MPIDSATNIGRRNAVWASVTLGLLATSTRASAASAQLPQNPYQSGAKFAAEEILLRLNWALDEGNFGQAGEFFSVDATLQYGDDVIKGRTAITDSLLAKAAKYAGCVSIATNIVFYANSPRSVNTRSYRLVYSESPPDFDLHAPSLVALYKLEDVLESNTAGWLIRHRIVRTIAEAPYPW